MTEERETGIDGYPRLNAEDWRTIHRVFDEHVELQREVSEDYRDIKYLEVVRDQIAAEMVDAITRERRRRVDESLRARLQVGVMPKPSPETVREPMDAGGGNRHLYDPAEGDPVARWDRMKDLADLEPNIEPKPEDAPDA